MDELMKKIHYGRKLFSHNYSHLMKNMSFDQIKKVHDGLCKELNIVTIFNAHKTQSIRVYDLDTNGNDDPYVIEIPKTRRNIPKMQRELILKLWG